MNPSEKPNNLLDFSPERAKTIDDIGELGLQGVAIIDGKTIEYSIDNDRNLKMAQSGDTIKSDALIRKIANGEIEVVSNEYKKAFGEFKLSSDNEKEKLRKTDTPAYAPNIDHRNIGEGEAKFDAGGDFSPADFRPDEEKDVAHQQKADAIKNNPEHKEIRDSKTPAYQKNSKEVDAQKVGTHWEHDAGKLELSAVEKLDNIGSMNKQELLEIMQNKKIVDSLSKEQLKQLKDRLKELLTTAGDTKNLADKLEKEVGKKKKRGPEDRERLNLRQKLYTATSSDEIKKIIQQLEAAGEKISTDSLEYQRLRLIESIENDYIGKKVSTTIAKGKTRSGTVTGIQLQTSGLGGYATRIRLVLDNNKKNAIPYEHAVKEGEKRSINETQQIIDAIDYDAESLKMKGKIVLDKNGAKIKLQQAVLSEKGQVGFSGTIEDGKTVFIDYHDLFDGLQKGDFKISIEKEENDDEKISDNTQRYIGKFISPDGGKTLYQVDSAEIVESDKDKHQKKLVLKTRALGGAVAKLFSTDNIPSPRKKGEKDENIFNAEKDGFSMVNRATHLQNLNDKFTSNMKEDFKDMNGFKKMWLSVKKSIKGQDLETGLSGKTQESLSELNTYLDRLTTTMADRLRERGYSAEDIEKAKRRYRAKYMASLEVRSERQKLKDEKEDRLTDNPVGRGIKWFKGMGEKYPSFRSALGYGAIGAAAAMKGLRVMKMFSGAGAGILAGTAVRKIGDHMWEDSDKANTERAKLTTEIDKTKEVLEQQAQKIKELIAHDPEFKNPQTKIDIREIGHQMREVKSRMRALGESVDNQSGRINKKRAELAKQYDNGAIPLSAFLKEDERLEKLETKARTIWRSLAIIATIGAGLAVGGIPDLDFGDADEAGVPKGPHALDEVVITPDDADIDILEGSESDALAQKGDGVTQVFKRQLDDNADLVKGFEEKLGMDYESNKPLFLKKMAEEFGYIDSNGDQVRILDGHGAGYQLQIDSDGNPNVQEIAGGKNTETHAWGDGFEKGSALDNYEYPKNGEGTGPDGRLDGDPVGPDGRLDGDKVDPAQALEVKENATLQKNIISKIDSYVDDFDGRKYAGAMNMQAQALLDADPQDLTDAQKGLQEIIKDLDLDTDPLAYESSEEYLNRVLRDADAPFNIEDIEEHRAFDTNKDIITDSVPDGENLDAQQNADVAEVIDQRPRLAYKDYMDNWFEKDGAGINNWVIEGTDIHFDQISNLSAREVFYALENGNVTPEILGNQLQIPQAAADRLFDFYEETKQLAETTMGSNYVTENMTIKDIVRDVTSRRVVDQ